MNSTRLFFKDKKRIYKCNTFTNAKRKGKITMTKTTTNLSIEELQSQISDLQKEKSILEQKVKIYQTEADRYNKLKSDIEFLTQQKNDIGRQITSSSELAGLTVRLQNLLETELAPIKFKRCMENINNDEVCMGNLMDIIHKLDSWSDEMKRLLNNDYIVDVQ